MRRSLKMLGLTFSIVCALSGYAAASSFAAQFHFGDGAKELVPNGTLFQSNLKSKTSASLSSTVGGVPVTLTSSNGVTEGTLNNEGGVGHAKEATLTFTGVTVSLSGCTVESPGAGAGTVVTKLLKGEALAGPAVEFKPEVETTFVELVFGGGAGCALNGVHAKVTGTARGLASSTNNELRFTTTSGSNLMLGGNKATFTATFLTTAAGRPVVVE